MPPAANVPGAPVISEIPVCAAPVPAPRTCPKVPAPACILAGGETTVRIQGRGKGGRNQELALAGALDLKDWSHIALLSAGTDGTDGPTDAAGALVDGDTCRQAWQRGLNPAAYLENNDSYNFFDRLGQLFKTGPTRTNVMDLMCLLVDKRSSHW